MNDIYCLSKFFVVNLYPFSLTKGFLLSTYSHKLTSAIKSIAPSAQPPQLPQSQNLFSILPIYFSSLVGKCVHAPPLVLQLILPSYLWIKGVYGERETKNINSHKCYVFTYSEDDEYQDANGALYDTVTRSWRN